MKILYIDIETTGLDPDIHQILEFGAVLEDLQNRKPLNELPKFNVFVQNSPIIGDMGALAMHSKLFADFFTCQLPIVERHELAERFNSWLLKYYPPKARIVLGGKNVAAFDLQFLRKIIGFSRNGVGEFRFDHRVVDPSILYFDPTRDDFLPGLGECLNRASIVKATDHRAVSDCLLVAELIRHKFPQV